MVKKPPANAGDVGLIPGLGRSPGGGNVMLGSGTGLQRLEGALLDWGGDRVTCLNREYHGYACV